MEKNNKNRKIKKTPDVRTPQAGFLFFSQFIDLLYFFHQNRMFAVADAFINKVDYSYGQGKTMLSMETDKIGKKLPEKIKHSFSKKEYFAWFF